MTKAIKLLKDDALFSAPEKIGLLSRLIFDLERTFKIYWLSSLITNIIKVQYWKHSVTECFLLWCIQAKNVIDVTREGVRHMSMSCEIWDFNVKRGIGISRTFSDNGSTPLIKFGWRRRDFKQRMCRFNWVCLLAYRILDKNYPKLQKRLEKNFVVCLQSLVRCFRRPISLRGGRNFLKTCKIGVQNCAKIFCQLHVTPLKSV